MADKSEIETRSRAKSLLYHLKKDKVKVNDAEIYAGMLAATLIILNEWDDVCK